MATNPEPFTQPWIASYRTRLEPSLGRLQSAAMFYVWDWLERYWSEEGEHPKQDHHLFVREALPFFDEVQRATGEGKDDASVALIRFLHSLNSPLAV